jgi:hypothetical protein
VANPDGIEYTPVSHGLSSWQLYHGPGFWAPVHYPVGDWFTIRLAVAGRRAEVFVADLDTPALVIPELKRPVTTGGIGLQVGGPGLLVARFAWTSERPIVTAAPDPDDRTMTPRPPGVSGGWEVSEPFAEADLGAASGVPSLAGVRVTGWTPVEAEPGGLVDLAMLHGIGDGRETVLARTTLHAEADEIATLEFGFSDRAVVFLDGRPVFRGDDAYRSRDYRFLGSIGWWDTVYLPLRAGPNELVVAVSETFGGWGLQARLVEKSPGSP